MSVAAPDQGAQRPVPRLPFVCYMAVVLLLAAASLIWLYTMPMVWPPIRSDGVGYWLYLPSVAIHHDPGLEALPEGMPSIMLEMAGVRRIQSTGRGLIRYTMGTAMLQAPFFAVADAWACLTGEARSGFSQPYQVMSMVSALFWLTVGSWFTYALLASLFSVRTALFALGTHTFGTALFHYATFDASFSHVYSFALLAMLLTLVRDRQRSLRWAVACGVVTGLVFLVRVPNALAGLFLILGRERPLDAVRHWRRELPVWLVMALAFLACISPQLAYWKYVSGHLLVSGYGDEWFLWHQPQIMNVLFSMKKGLFFYSPLLVLSVLGLGLLRGDARRFLWPSAVFLPVMTYVLSCWWNWYYGGGLGQRVFTDFTALFCLGFAALLHAVPRGRPRICLLALGKLLALAGLLYMYLYWRGLIPYDGPDWPVFKIGVLEGFTFGDTP